MAVTFRAIFHSYSMIPFNDLESLERELKKGDVAAFIVEPIQGKGVNLPAPGYLREAVALCRKHGAVFIDRFDLLTDIQPLNDG